MKLLITETQIKKLVENTIDNHFETSSGVGEPRLQFINGKDSPLVPKIIERTKKVYHGLKKGSSNVTFVLTVFEDGEEKFKDVKFKISYLLPPIEDATFSISYSDSKFENLKCDIFTNANIQPIKFKIDNWWDVMTDEMSMQNSGEAFFIYNNYYNLVSAVIQPKFEAFGITFNR